MTDERTARLNVDLAERTRLAVGKDKPTRAVITVSTTAVGRLGNDLSAEYAGAGISDVEIRRSATKLDTGDRLSVTSGRSGPVYAFQHVGYMHTSLGIEGFRPVHV